MHHSQNNLSKESSDFVSQRLKSTRRRIHWLKRLNEGLLYVFGFLCIYALGDTYILSQPIPDNVLKVSVSSAQTIQEVAQEEFTRTSFNRNIFEPYVSGRQQTQNVSAYIENLKGRYRIVGIVLGEASQVMIEDQKTNETTFFNIGDSFEGAFVERIESDCIWLKVKGQAFEMQS